MKHKLLLSSVLSLLTLTSMAQQPATSSDKGTPPGLGLGLNLSTNGVGLQIAHTLNKQGTLAARLEGRYLPLKAENLEVDVEGTSLIADLDTKFGSMGLMVDWHPFGNAFKITGGFAILLNDISGTAITKDSTKQGDIMLAPEEVGTLTFGLKAKASPYIGIGFGRAIPKTRFGFTFEVGSFYTGAQDVTFKATGMLEPSSSNEAVLQDNLSGLTWWPVMNFGFNFRLTQ
ncbi:MAG: hypothetical protein FGM41_00820 [Bacteroidetes bacterium]|nr:hypothetical protein [Bacteroidota bacterium]